MRYLVIGANGQLGGDIVQVLKDSYPQHSVIPLTHADIEVTDEQSVRSGLEMHRPDVVIDTAAYHKVDELETYPDKAFAVNAVAPLTLARLCKEMNAVLVFISTDYVFGKDALRASPYAEQDRPGPLNVYGATKVAGEYLVESHWEKHYIVRTSGLYGLRGASGKGGNFVELMLRLAREGKEIKVVNDQRLTPTYTIDLAAALLALVETGRFGLYHITSEDDCTWYEFAGKVFELSGLKPNFRPSTTSEFKAPAIRPGYSVLAKNGIYAAGLPRMRPWQQALEAYLKARNEKPAARK